MEVIPLELLQNRQTGQMWPLVVGQKSSRLTSDQRWSVLALLGVVGLESGAAGVCRNHQVEPSTIACQGRQAPSFLHPNLAPRHGVGGLCFHPCCAIAVCEEQDVRQQCHVWCNRGVSGPVPVI